MSRTSQIKIESSANDRKMACRRPRHPPCSAQPDRSSSRDLPLSRSSASTITKRSRPDMPDRLPQTPDVSSSRIHRRRSGRDVKSMVPLYLRPNVAQINVEIHHSGENVARQEEEHQDKVRKRPTRSTKRTSRTFIGENNDSQSDHVKRRRLENGSVSLKSRSSRVTGAYQEDDSYTVDSFQDDDDEDLEIDIDTEKEDVPKIEKVFACRWRPIVQSAPIVTDNNRSSITSINTQHASSHTLKPVDEETHTQTYESSAICDGSTSRISTMEDMTKSLPNHPPSVVHFVTSGLNTSSSSHSSTQKNISVVPSMTVDSLPPLHSPTSHILPPVVVTSSPPANSSSELALIVASRPPCNTFLPPSTQTDPDIHGILTRKASIDMTKREMEYLVKYEGVSYRNLQWKSRSELVLQKNDAADSKIQHFHRKMTPGYYDKEVPLSSQDEGNILLYGKIDRVISVRPAERQVVDKSIQPKQQHLTPINQSKKEYLVKWQLLGYADSTWEDESNLETLEDQKAVKRFHQVNLSLEFPVSVSLPLLKMAFDVSPMSRDRATWGSNDEQSEEVHRLSLKEPLEFPSAPCGGIKGEVYNSDAVMKREGMTRLWQTFLKHKLAADGTYIPSILCNEAPKSVSDSSNLCKKNEGTHKFPVGALPDLQSARSLMAHQQEGIKWMFFNSEINHHGSLLADEMGLGKTCQSIAFLEHYLDIVSAGRGTGCHALVVVQKSVVENWRREFQLWAPHLNVLPLCGGRKDREIAKRYESKWLSVETGEVVSIQTSAGAKKLIKPDVVLVTYEGLRTVEFQQLTGRNFKWGVVVVDECQKVKGGKTSLLLQCLSQLKRDIMILLTGTPVQNTTEELFPMLTLLHPSRFFYEEAKEMKSSLNCWSANRFNQTFTQIQNRENCMQLTEDLHQLMAPYILRREKAHVLKTLPPKTVKLVKIPLTLIQKRVYSALYHRSIRTRGLKFSNIHIQLRKCCIHPYLIEGMEELIFDGKIGQKDRLEDEGPDHEGGTTTVNQSGSDRTIDEGESNDATTPKPETQEEKAKRLILESSGKLVLLKKMLESFRQAERKVLIFSFFKTALDLIEDFLHLYQFPWVTERVDGETSGEDRQLAIDRFNSDPSRFLFLCTTRAGGLGINLTAASVVIHLDSDFNPQHDLQAQARCHRIGQDKNVDVFHFIAEHSYEDYMLFTIAGKKLGLEAVLLGRLDATRGKAKLDKQQEEKVLRKGVFAAIRDDEAARKEAQKFAESSIEEILSTKSTTVILEGDTSGSNEDTTEITALGDEDVEFVKNIKGEREKKNQPHQATRHMLSSTAKFVVNDNSDEVGLEGLDEDEPDFWVKVAQRLGPWVLEEEKPRELTRADRRKGKNVNYRSAFYDDEYHGRSHRQARRLPRCSRSTDEPTTSSSTHGDLSEDEDTGSCHRKQRFRKEDDDDAFTPSSESSQGLDTDDGDEDEASVKDINEGGLAAEEKNRLSSMPLKHKRSKADKVALEPKGKQRPSFKDTMNWSNWTDSFQPIAGPQGSSTSSPSSTALRSTCNSGNQPPANTSIPPSFGLPIGSQGGLLVLDLLFRCLRALKRWRHTKVGETGGLRTDDIRDADRSSPWSLSSSAASQRPTSGADQLLRQSWLDTLQEWRHAGIDWEGKRSLVIDHCAKLVIETKREELEHLWLGHLKTYNVLSTVKSKEQLIQQMNQFFITEARRQAILIHLDTIYRELQKFCDLLAMNVLKGKHFSREYTIKKQTWIGAEDFCIKLVFVHLMAQRYAATNSNGGSPPQPTVVMRWPPPQLEINWAIVTEVVKRLNRYTGGPERRRAAIHERFYNKLDSRWNHEDFTQAERGALAIAVSNGLAAHVVAEEMPGRSLERVKKGMRCPSVIREAQNPDLIISPPMDGNGNSGRHTTIVDIISRFREICQELGFSNRSCNNAPNNENIVASGTSATTTRPTVENPGLPMKTPTLFSHCPSSEMDHLKMCGVVQPKLPLLALPPSKTVPSEEVQLQSSNSQQHHLSPMSLIIESIRFVLLGIGVQENDFEALRPALMSQPLENLTTLLKQLKDVQLREEHASSTAASSLSSVPSASHSLQQKPTRNLVPTAPRDIASPRLAPKISIGFAPQKEGLNSVVVLDDDVEVFEPPNNGTMKSGNFHDNAYSHQHPPHQQQPIKAGEQKELLPFHRQRPEAPPELKLKTLSRNSSSQFERNEQKRTTTIEERTQFQRKLRSLLESSQFHQQSDASYHQETSSQIVSRRQVPQSVPDQAPSKVVTLTGSLEQCDTTISPESSPTTQKAKFCPSVAPMDLDSFDPEKFPKEQLTRQQHLKCIPTVASSTAVSFAPLPTSTSSSGPPLAPTSPSPAATVLDHSSTSGISPQDLSAVSCSVASSASSTFSISPTQLQQSLQILLKIARPDQLDTINQQIAADPLFAAKVVERISMIQQRTGP